jgi:hypothetical protein
MAAITMDEDEATGAASATEADERDAADEREEREAVTQERYMRVHEKGKSPLREMSATRPALA